MPARCGLPWGPVSTQAQRREKAVCKPPVSSSRKNRQTDKQTGVTKLLVRVSPFIPEVGPVQRVLDR